jgi:hypothetical protein
MGLAKELPTLAEMQALRRAPAKGVPAVIAREEKKRSKDALGEAFRKAVWKRDGRKSRASRTPLSPSGTDPHKIGEVHHEYKRSTHPDRIYDVTCGVLLSRYEHRLAETRCVNAPEFFMLSRTGQDDLGQPQTWVWRDIHGQITKTRIG